MSAIHGNQSGTIPPLVLGVTMEAFGNTMTKMTTKGPAPQAQSGAGGARQPINQASVHLLRRNPPASTG
jgi:hypothetical protein